MKQDSNSVIICSGPTKALSELQLFARKTIKTGMLYVIGNVIDTCISDLICFHECSI